jgi:hypothetical protein
MADPCPLLLNFEWNLIIVSTLFLVVGPLLDTESGLSSIRNVITFARDKLRNFMRRPAFATFHDFVRRCCATLSDLIIALILQNFHSNDISPKCMFCDIPRLFATLP